MARKRDRVFALTVAAAFLFTTVGVSVVLIWQVVSESKNNTQPNNGQTQQAILKGSSLQGFTPVAKVEKLETIDLQLGTGNEVKAGDTVTVDYTGALAATGKIFESSLDSGQPVSLSLTDGPNGVIEGWREGLVGMKVGGKRRLLIPAAKAYADHPPSDAIPPNADLVFDVTLHQVRK